MPKINKNKKAKKPYEKSSSSNNAKSSSSGAQEPPKESEQVDSSQSIQAECCSQCRDSSRGLLQCECCNLWYCGGCSGIAEETMNVIGEIDCLHYFCSPCKLEVFKLMNNGESANLSSCETAVSEVSVVTSAITAAIKDFQDTLQNTLISTISQQFKGTPNFVMQSPRVIEADTDVSQEMDSQFNETEQPSGINCQPISTPHLHHKEITEAVSSVLREEKEKSKRKLNTTSQSPMPIMRM